MPRVCAPRNRCRLHHTCDACAAIRQARIADTAEQILAGHLQLQLIVLKPMDRLAGSLRSAIKSCIRNNHLPAGIWTIERGQKTGLMHGNLITSKTQLVDSPGIETFAEPIHTNVRAVAAYISKREQHPGREHWSGRTYASWGHISQTLLGGKMPAIINGAAIEHQMQQASKVAAPPQPAPQVGPSDIWTPEQYRECAARNLPILAAIGDQFKRR